MIALYLFCTWHERLRCTSPVSVMETTDFRDRNDRPGACFRDRSRIGRVVLDALPSGAARTLLMIAATNSRALVDVA
jgi:hypothetical protein